jgi:hypothetical protein
MRVLMAALAMWLGGCAFLSVTDVSRPTIEGHDRPALTRDGVLTVEGVRLAISPGNERVRAMFVGPGIVVPLPIVPVPVPDRPQPEQFWLDIHIDPEGEDVTFDAGGVRLRVGDEERAPMAVIGPVYAWTQRDKRGCATGRRPPRPIVEPLPVKELACFRVLFERPAPLPDQPFTVHIAGIANRGQPVTVPSLNFSKRSEWELGGAP